MLAYMEPARRKRSAVHAPEYQFLLRRLREARKASGLTQAEVAKALRRTQSFVTKCELGERRIDPVDLGRFAKIYGRPISYFFPKS